MEGNPKSTVSPENEIENDGDLYHDAEVGQMKSRLMGS